MFWLFTALPTLILQLSTHASAFDMYRYVRASIAPTFRTSGYIQNPLDCTQQLTDLDTAWRTCMNINLGPLCVSDPNCFVLQPRGMPCVFNISSFQATPWFSWVPIVHYYHILFPLRNGILLDLINIFFFIVNWFIIKLKIVNFVLRLAISNEQCNIKLVWLLIPLLRCQTTNLPTPI